jgi:hypothetical protein
VWKLRHDALRLFLAGIRNSWVSVTAHVEGRHLAKPESTA